MTEFLGKESFENGVSMGLPSNDIPLTLNSESDVLTGLGVTGGGLLEFQNIPGPKRQTINTASAISQLHRFAFMITYSMERDLNRSPPINLLSV
ncbi:MAG: hypothetical protein K9M08_23975 [Pirellula sp.]|nr:hypothetical protein [Pirellula sp.]